MQAAPARPEAGSREESARRGREYDRRDRWQPRTSPELDARVPWNADLKGRRSRRRAECATCRLPMPEWAENEAGHRREEQLAALSELESESKCHCACACPRVADQLNQHQRQRPAGAVMESPFHCEIPFSPKEHRRRVETSRREKEPKWNTPRPLASKELRTNFWNHWKENDWRTAAVRSLWWRWTAARRVMSRIPEKRKEIARQEPGAETAWACGAVHHSSDG